MAMLQPTILVGDIDSPNAIAQPTMMMARFAVFATEWVTPEILPMTQESDLIRPSSGGRRPEISAVSRLYLGCISARPRRARA